MERGLVSSVLCPVATAEPTFLHAPIPAHCCQATASKSFQSSITYQRHGVAQHLHPPNGAAKHDD